MNYLFQNCDCHPNQLRLALQVFLFGLIIIGVGLLLSQQLWVPKLVDYILQKEVVDAVLVSERTTWQTFTLDTSRVYAPYFAGTKFDQGFSFKYPNDWILREDNPVAIIDLYSPRFKRALEECLNGNTEIQPACNFNSQITLFPHKYVEYQNLDEVSDFKSNYPNYEKIDLPILDIFKYYGNEIDSSNSVEIITYHLNFPDQKTGIEFKTSEPYEVVLLEILKTFTFSEMPPPVEEEKPEAPVVITPTKEECRPGGCSGQICTDQPDLVTTCEYKEEYACYQSAKCKRQETGQCGWTETAELRACLNTKSSSTM